MQFKVFKFGGASVQNAHHIRNVKQIVEDQNESKLILIISALGKTTNALEGCLDLINSDPSRTLDVISEIKDDHLAIAQDLGIDAELLDKKYVEYLKGSRQRLENQNDRTNDFVYDQIVSLGELFSTEIVNQFFIKSGLNSCFLDVRDVIETEELYKRSNVNMKVSNKKVNDKIEELFGDHNIVITQGFLGKAPSGNTTTLGREGSDYTAALFAYFLEADELTIWKDVPGILTADPKKFENVEKIDSMSYKEAIEMTYYGAKVIHPKTIQPIQNKNIVLRVNSYLNPEGEGTVISSKGMLNYPPIVVIEDDVILIQISSKDFSFIQEEHLSNIFSVLKRNRLKLLSMRNSAISFTICIKDPGDSKLDQFIEDLGSGYGTDIFTGLQMITVRHFTNNLIKDLTENKVVLFEEILKDTVQLVVKPSLTLKEKT